MGPPWINAAAETDESSSGDLLTETIDQNETAFVPQYHVVLLDDDDHSYDYVVEMLCSIFGHSQDTAFRMACEVDAKGRVIVFTTYKERAEMKQDQIQGYGADWRIPRCKGSMSAIVEPAT
jgi:ATP-dependent Clp protease adaptor protein ClpS